MNMVKSALVLTILLAPLIAVAQSKEGNELHPMNRQFAETINKKKEETGLVGLSVLVLKNGDIALSASSGERKKGSGVLVTGAEKWHLGSITKSFTSTMIARLIEKEQLHWDTRVGDVFQGEDIDDEWWNVTLSQLLTHTAGVKANFSVRTMLFKKPDEGEELATSREREVLKVLKEPPKATPGSTFIYSNLGYTIAATMAEKATGDDWSALVAREVIVPLEMESAEFDPSETNGDDLSQPRGHRRLFGFTFAASPTADNPPLIAPAGRLYMTLADLASYANDHLQGELGHGKLLQTETYRRLHSPVLSGYGYGWVTKTAEAWSEGDMLWHNGSNGLWHMLLVLVPETKSIVLVASNDGNIPVAEKNAWEIVEIALTTLKNAET